METTTVRFFNSDGVLIVALRNLTWRAAFEAAGCMNQQPHVQLGRCAEMRGDDGAVAVPLRGRA